MAQSATGSARARIAGVVTKDPGSEPVRKALVELIAENQSAGGNYTTVSGADGGFEITGILPGRYHLFVERTGYLELEKHRPRTEGRILSLTAGQELKDVTIHLQAAAVVRGRVVDEDGDPLPNAQVAVLRQTFTSGRYRMEQASAERTNDLGEYRLAGLPAGKYYVSVSPAPDFRSLIDTSSIDTHSPEKSATTYPTTYYPGTPDRAQAAPIQLHAGDDFPIDFSLTPSPSLSIRGSVVNVPARGSAVIMLQSRDFNLTMNGAEVHRDGSFVIRDVAPGSYTISATVEDSAVPLMARQALHVAGSSVDGLRLAPQPGAWVHGRLRIESKSGFVRIDPSQMFLVLHSVDGDDEGMGGFSAEAAFSNLAHVLPDGSFEWRNVPPGNYYAQLNAGPDLYLKGASAGGRDAEESAISVSGGTLVLDLVASANGGVVQGIVVDANGVPVPDAVVVAAPEARLRGRVDRYSKTISDQSGHFVLQGVRPGDYTLFAWESVEGEAYYNPDFLKASEGQGSALRVGEAEHKSVQLVAIPEVEDQQ